MNASLKAIRAETFEEIVVKFAAIATEFAALSKLFERHFRSFDSVMEPDQSINRARAEEGSRAVKLAGGRLLTRKEAADIVQMSETWIKRQIAAKKLSCVSLGKAVRVEESELEEFIKRRKKGME